MIDNSAPLRVSAYCENCHRKTLYVLVGNFVEGQKKSDLYKCSECKESRDLEDIAQNQTGSD